MTATIPAGLADVAGSEATLRAFLHGLPGVDQVGADARAAMLGTRSIKTTAKAWAIDLAISMVDLTTLEGADTAGKVRSLCAKAVRPDPGDLSCPSVAAVCVYPSMVATARAALQTGTAQAALQTGTARAALQTGTARAALPAAGPPVRIASVASGFPAGQVPLAVKLEDTRGAVAAGADEIDMVINRGAFLSGRYLEVFEEIAAIKDVCPPGVHLKVILETGELVTYDNARRASWLAMVAGADFIKTSTGKVSPAATLPVTIVMLEAVRDFRALTGSQVGVKPAGGIRTSKDAIKYLVAVNETAGPDWLDPHWFRFGASTLLNDLLMQRSKLATGRYSGPDYVTVD